MAFLINAIVYRATPFLITFPSTGMLVLTMPDVVRVYGRYLCSYNCILISGILLGCVCVRVCYDCISIAFIAVLCVVLYILYCNYIVTVVFVLLFIDLRNDSRGRWFPRRTYSIIIIIVVADHIIIISIISIIGVITGTGTVVVVG